MNTALNCDVLIIGGGAAGLMCAITASQCGKDVVVIEHNQRVGNKILISGGGRCNFTNSNVSSEDFISGNPHFVKSALSQYTNRDFINFVISHEIDFYEKKLGQLFCKKSSRQIFRALLEECKNNKVQIFTDTKVLACEKHEETFLIETNKIKMYSQSLVVATGGLSFAKLGASDFGYQVARQFGHEITQLRPALVPLFYQKKELQKYSLLAGNSVVARVKIGKKEITEDILWTHKGVSGPAVLKISNYWDEGQVVEIDLLPGVKLYESLLAEKDLRGKSQLKTILYEYLSKKVISVFLQKDVLEKKIGELSNQTLKNVAEALQMWRFTPKSTGGYELAEVTRGGIATSQVSSKTMESKLIKGLFFIGEVLDVTGNLGGYNFQWAWSSGFVAGKNV